MPRDSDRSRSREVNEAEGFVSRWSRRKTEKLAVVEEEKVSGKTSPSKPLKIDEESGHPSEQATDADMPALDSLGEDSDYSGFMSPEVSEELRTLALRKLFHLPQYNVTDGLNDYDEDYTSFAKLGNVLTHEMRRMRELEEKRTVKHHHDEAEGVAQTAAKSETSDSSELEDSVILEPDTDAEKTDEIGGGEKDKAPPDRD